MNKVYDIIKSDLYKDKSIKIIKHKINQGVSAARNNGIRQASSNYVFFMDADDIITPQCIEIHVNAINASMADYTVAGIDVIGSRSIHIPKLRSQVVNNSILKYYLKRRWDSGPCNKLIKREFIIHNNILFTEGIRFEDVLWGYNMAKCASKVELISQKTYKYIMHEGSFVTSKNSLNKISDLLFVVKNINSDNIDKKILPTRNKYLSFSKVNQLYYY